MTSYKVPQGTIDAAKTLLAAGEKYGYVTQVYEVVLRDHDSNADPEEARKVYLVPIGSTIGVAVVTGRERPKDADFAFVSAAAFGNALPALGFTVAVRPVGASYLVSPEDG